MRAWVGFNLIGRGPGWVGQQSCNTFRPACSYLSLYSRSRCCMHSKRHACMFCCPAVRAPCPWPRPLSHNTQYQVPPPLTLPPHPAQPSVKQSALQPGVASVFYNLVQQTRSGAEVYVRDVPQV